MEITQFIIDAFTNKVFQRNPAAICLIEKIVIGGECALYSKSHIFI